MVHRAEDVWEVLGEARRREAAYHESGHAVIAIVVGISFEFVSIVPDDDRFGLLGKVRRRQGPYHLAQSYEGIDPIAVKRDAEQVLLFTLAGRQAERAHLVATHGPNSEEVEAHDEGGSLDGDEEDARELAEYLAAVDGDELEVRLGQASAECARLLDDPEVWAAIETLATALLEASLIDYAHVLKITGPLAQARS